MFVDNTKPQCLGVDSGVRRGKLEAGDGFYKCTGRVSFHCLRVMGNGGELPS